MRKLQADNSEMPGSTEPENTEAETTNSWTPETQSPTTTVPVEPGNATETQTPETTIPPATTIWGPVTTIPSIISQPTYNPLIKEPSKLVLVGLGNFKMPQRRPGVIVEQKAVFEVYYKRIMGTLVLSVRMYLTIRVTYIRLRSLEEKDEQAVCTRISFDQDPNIRYNCSFDVDENAELGKVTMDPTTPPTFEGMSDAITPEITVSSLANETMTEKGIQSVTGNELLKTQYLLNNTILEENGLRFKLTGDMDGDLSDRQQITLSFDEKGNGKIKNATCDINNIQGRVYELDCLAERVINAHLNAVSGVTSSTQEKVVIYMKPDTDEYLNAGSNYMGLYNRKSSSGLSGGVIAGIVVACVVALLAATIAALLCKKANVPVPFQESTLGINTSNMAE